VQYLSARWQMPGSHFGGWPMRAQTSSRLVFLQAYHHCKNMGRADPDDRTNFENLYTQYHFLGWNGVMDDIRQKFFNLPM